MRRLAAVLALALLALPALSVAATNYERFVNAGADALGNGTTNATSGGNHAYQSIALAEGDAGIPSNLTTASDTYTITCGGSTADTTTALVVGWTTSATSTITIRADSSSWAGTSWSTGKYRLSYTPATNGNAILIQEEYTFLRGLQIELVSTGDSATSAVKYDTVAALGDIDSCFIRNLVTGTTVSGRCIYVSTSGSSIDIYNTICVSRSARNNLNNSAVMNADSTGTLNIYNSTVICTGANARGINLTGGTINSKNCYVSATNCYVASAGTHNQTTNASSDATADGTALDSIAFSTSSGAYFSNVGSGTEDLAINTGSALIGVGTDNPGSGLYSDDINNATRTSTWDIGADELVAGGGGGASAPWWVPLLNRQGEYQ